MHYYCRKQHKKIKNWWTVEQNPVLLLPFSLFSVTCASWCLPHWQSFFISWTQYSTNFEHHKWSFVLNIVSFCGLKLVFSKLSLLDITACTKNCVYNNFNLCYFMSSIIEILYKSFLIFQASNCIKEGLQQRYFHVNIRKFIRTPIFKNICKCYFCIFVYCFLRAFFRL